MPQQIVQDTIAAHRRREKRRWTIMLLFIVFCLITFILDLTNGAAGGKISAKDVLYALLQFRDTAPEAGAGSLALHWYSFQQWLGIGGVDNITHIIVNHLRLPIALMALVAGEATGAVGAELETLLNNPMASPYTLGMAAAAGFGASLVVVFGTFGLSVYVAQPLSAFLMTMLAAGITFIFAPIRRFP